MQNYIQNNPELAKKIEQLFGSSDENNLALACQLMKGGGMPPGIRKKLVNSPKAGLFFLTRHGLVHHFSQSRSLDLGRLGLTSLPPEIAQLTQLEKLSVFYNHLTFVPEAVYQLPRLKVLLLHWNQLTCLPEQLGNLCQLEELTLCFNQLKELPQTINKLSKLRVLHLHHNELTSLPYSLNNLPCLEKITLWGNAFDIKEEVHLTDIFTNVTLMF